MMIMLADFSPIGPQAVNEKSRGSTMPMLFRIVFMGNLLFMRFMYDFHYYPTLSHPFFCLFVQKERTPTPIF